MLPSWDCFTFDKRHVQNSASLKSHIFYFFKELQRNRTDNVEVCRVSTTYSGDITFNKNGVSHSVARGRVDIDGDGNMRAYNHLI